MLKFLSILLLFTILSFSAIPMEALNNYNIILVHGAADMRSGLDCDDEIRDAYDEIYKNGIESRIGGYGSAWFWEGDFHGGFAWQDEAMGVAGVITDRLINEDKK